MSTDAADTKPGSFYKPIVIDEVQESFVEKINAQREKNVEKFHILLDQYNVARKALADAKGTAITLFDLQGFQVYAVNEKLARKKLGGLLKRAGLVLVSKPKTESV